MAPSTRSRHKDGPRPPASGASTSNKKPSGSGVKKSSATTSARKVVDEAGKRKRGESKAGETKKPKEKVPRLDPELEAPGRGAKIAHLPKAAVKPKKKTVTPPEIVEPSDDTGDEGSDKEASDNNGSQRGDDVWGEDDQDYAGVDILDPNENPRFASSSASGEGAESCHGSDASDSESNELEGSKQGGDVNRKSKLSEKQKKKQVEEQPRWAPGAEFRQTGDPTESSDSDESDSRSESSDADGDPQSIVIRRPMKGRGISLKKQPPRIWKALKESFAVAEERLCFNSAYPPADDADRFFRNMLRDAARMVEDRELAREFKTNAAFGNRLLPLTKHRFSRYRLKIRDHAITEAKATYGLTPSSACAGKVSALLRDDTFVYGVDDRGNAVTQEPYQHPAIVHMIQWFFKDAKSVGQSQIDRFASSLTKDENGEEMMRKEIPIPMLAFSVTMLRAELSLWQFGRRGTAKFDIDSHYSVYEHHADALTSLKNRFPLKFGILMGFLYKQASSAAALAAGQGCDGDGVLGILDWDEENAEEQ